MSIRVCWWPQLWNIKIDQLLHQLSVTCRFSAFADDLLLLIEWQSRAQLKRDGAQAMTLVEGWGRRVGVELNKDKTQTMLLKGKFNGNRHPIIRVGSTSLRYTTQVNYLGVTIGERLNFLSYVEETKNKLLTVVGQVRHILRAEWGLSCKSVRQVYKDLFVACATYASSAWGDVVLKEIGRKKTLSCQHVMILGCLNVCKTVSTETLQVLRGVPPLDMEVTKRAVAFKLRRGMTESVDSWVVPGIDTWGRKQVKDHLEECVLVRWQNRWDNNVNR